MTITKVEEVTPLQEETEEEWEEEMESLRVMNEQLEKELPVSNRRFCFQK